MARYRDTIRIERTGVTGQDPETGVPTTETTVLYAGPADLQHGIDRIDRAAGREAHADLGYDARVFVPTRGAAAVNLRDFAEGDTLIDVVTGETALVRAVDLLSGKLKVQFAVPHAPL